MVPTLIPGQRVLTNRLISHPSVGDIVVFHPPAGADPITPVCGNPNEGAGHAQACDRSTAAESSQTFIKRVVGGPGDTIVIEDGHVYRNGRREKDPYIEPCGAGSFVQFPYADQDSARRLLHDGGQPWSVGRQPLLGSGPGQVDHRGRVLHLLAPRPDRLPLRRRPAARRRRARSRRAPAVQVRPLARRAVRGGCRRSRSRMPCRPARCRRGAVRPRADRPARGPRAQRPERLQAAAARGSGAAVPGDPANRREGRDRVALRAGNRLARPARHQSCRAARSAREGRLPRLHLPQRRLPGRGARTSTSAP